MKKEITRNSNWQLITILDLEYLPGKSILNMIHILLKIIKYQFVIFDYIYGAGISSLLKKENTIMTIDELSNILPDVQQFDWGDFFLFKKYPKSWNNLKGELYPYVISQTDTTIRAVDDAYIYVYTPYQEIVAIIKENYKIESLKIDLLEHLDYPE